MFKTFGSAVAGLVLMTGVALAATPHAPNDVGTAFMGGGTYYNPDPNDLYARPDVTTNPATGAKEGYTQEGGSIYHTAPQH